MSTARAYAWIGGPGLPFVTVANLGVSLDTPLADARMLRSRAVTSMHYLPEHIQVAQSMWL